jgi:alpha-1,2-mannosyltransferase
MLLPLALLGVAKAYAAFLAVTAGLATVLVGRRDGWAWLAIVTSPAALWVVVAGQNTFLSVALFYGGMGLVRRAPAAAGILLGLLAYKPQLWILIPLALLAARQWRALAWMAGTVAATALASLAVLGIDVWWAFLESTRAGGRIANEVFVQVYTQMVTLFAAARIAGLPAEIASVLQLGSALACIVAVWLVFRRPGSWEMRTAFLAAATFLVSPYTMNYDLLLLMPAAVALFRAGMAEGFEPSEKPILLALWVMPTVGMYANAVGVPAIPVVILVFAILVGKRALRPPTAEHNAGREQHQRPA